MLRKMEHGRFKKLKELEEFMRGPLVWMHVERKWEPEQCRLCKSELQRQETAEPFVF